MQWVFAGCLLDLERRELRRSFWPVSVTPKVFDLLVHLATHRHRVISRDELIETVWGGRVVSDSTIASHINAARAAVGDDGEQQRVIKTIARKGFRFVAEIAEQSVPSGEKAATERVTTSLGDVLASKPSIAVLPFVNLSGDPTLRCRDFAGCWSWLATRASRTSTTLPM